MDVTDNKLSFERRISAAWGEMGQTGSFIPANIIMCWKFPLILCLLPRLRRKERG